MKIFSALLLLIGLAQVTGVAFSSDTLSEWARRTGSSPLPTIFSDIEGLEYWNVQITLTVTSTDQETQKIELDRHAYAQVHHGHLLQAANAIPLALAMSPQFHLWKTILAHNFCDNGPLAQDLHLKKPVQTVHLQINYLHRGKNRTTSREFTCG